MATSTIVTVVDESNTHHSVEIENATHDSITFQLPAGVGLSEVQVKKLDINEELPSLAMASTENYQPPQELVSQASVVTPKSTYRYDAPEIMEVRFGPGGDSMVAGSDGGIESATLSGVIAALGGEAVAKLEERKAPHRIYILGENFGEKGPSPDQVGADSFVNISFCDGDYPDNKLDKLSSTQVWLQQAPEFKVWNKLEIEEFAARVVGKIPTKVVWVNQAAQSVAVIFGAEPAEYANAPGASAIYDAQEVYWVYVDGTLHYKIQKSDFNFWEVTDQHCDELDKELRHCELVGSNQMDYTIGWVINRQLRCIPGRPEYRCLGAQWHPHRGHQWKNQGRPYLSCVPPPMRVGRKLVKISVAKHTVTMDAELDARCFEGFYGKIDEFCVECWRYVAMHPTIPDATTRLMAATCDGNYDSSYGTTMPKSEVGFSIMPPPRCQTGTCQQCNVRCSGSDGSNEITCTRDVGKIVKKGDQVQVGDHDARVVDRTNGNKIYVTSPLAQNPNAVPLGGGMLCTSIKKDFEEWIPPVCLAEADENPLHTRPYECEDALVPGQFCHPDRAKRESMDEDHQYLLNPNGTREICPHIMPCEPPSSCQGAGSCDLANGYVAYYKPFLARGRNTICNPLHYTLPDLYTLPVRDWYGAFRVNSVGTDNRVDPRRQNGTLVALKTSTGLMAWQDGQEVSMDAELTRNSNEKHKLNRQYLVAWRIKDRDPESFKTGVEEEMKLADKEAHLRTQFAVDMIRKLTTEMYVYSDFAANVESTVQGITSILNGQGIEVSTSEDAVNAHAARTLAWQYYDSEDFRKDATRSVFGDKQYDLSQFGRKQGYWLQWVSMRYLEANVGAVWWRLVDGSTINSACDISNPENNEACSCFAPRCGQCNPETHFRLDGVCEPCPDNPWLLPMMLVLIAISAGISMVVLNRYAVNMTILNIGIDYFQVLSLFSRSKTQWPPMMKFTLKYLQFFQLDLDLTGPECIARSWLTFEIKWYIKVLFPAIGGVIVALAMTQIGLTRSCSRFKQFGWFRTLQYFVPLLAAANVGTLLGGAFFCLTMGGLSAIGWSSRAYYFAERAGGFFGLVGAIIGLFYGWKKRKQMLPNILAFNSVIALAVSGLLLSITTIAPQVRLVSDEDQFKVIILGYVLPTLGVILIGAFGFYELSRIVRHEGTKSEIRKRKKQELPLKTQIVSMTNTMIYFLYLSITRTAFDIFNCVDTKPATGQQYLAAQPLEECYLEGGVQMKLSIPALLVLIFYCGGFPAYVLTLFTYLRPKILADQTMRAHGRGEDPLTNKNYGVRKMFGKMYMPYQPKYYWWAMIVLGKKFILCYFGIIFRVYPTFQMAMTLGVLFLAFVFQVTHHPFMGMMERAQIVKHEAEETLVKEILRLEKAQMLVRMNGKAYYQMVHKNRLQIDEQSKIMAKHHKGLRGYRNTDRICCCKIRCLLPRRGKLIPTLVCGKHGERQIGGLPRIARRLLEFISAWFQASVVGGLYGGLVFQSVYKNKGDVTEALSQGAIIGGAHMIFFLLLIYIGVPGFMFNYNFIESSFLAISVIVNLAGVMFDTTFVLEARLQPDRAFRGEVITWTVVLLIINSLFYFIAVFIQECISTAAKQKTRRQLIWSKVKSNADRIRGMAGKNKSLLLPGSSKSMESRVPAVSVVPKTAAGLAGFSKTVGAGGGNNSKIVPFTSIGAASVTGAATSGSGSDELMDFVLDSASQPVVASAVPATLSNTAPSANPSTGSSSQSSASSASLSSSSDTASMSSDSDSDQAAMASFTMEMSDRGGSAALSDAQEIETRGPAPPPPLPPRSRPPTAAAAAVSSSSESVSDSSSSVESIDSDDSDSD